MPLGLAVTIGVGLLSAVLRINQAYDDDEDETGPGTCFTSIEPDPQTVSCVGPHEAEVFAIVSDPAPVGAPVPTDLTHFAIVDDLCLQQFAGYVGDNFIHTRLDITTFRPDDARWKRGDREVLCVLMDPAETLIGSQRKLVVTNADRLVRERLIVLLDVGECVMRALDEPGDVWAVEVRECDQSHDREVYAVLEMPDLKDSSQVGEKADRMCLLAFDDYVGISFYDSSLDAVSLAPTPESWEVGDRGLVCLLMSGDSTPLDRSMRDAEI